MSGALSTPKAVQCHCSHCMLQLFSVFATGIFIEHCFRNTSAIPSEAVFWFCIRNNKPRIIESNSRYTSSCASIASCIYLRFQSSQVHQISRSNPPPATQHPYKYSGRLQQITLQRICLVFRNTSEAIFFGTHVFLKHMFFETHVKIYFSRLQLQKQARHH